MPFILAFVLAFALVYSMTRLARGVVLCVARHPVVALAVLTAAMLGPHLT